MNLWLTAYIIVGNQNSIKHDLNLCNILWHGSVSAKIIGPNVYVHVRKFTKLDLWHFLSKYNYQVHYFGPMGASKCNLHQSTACTCRFLLEYRPGGLCLAVKAPLLHARANVPYDDLVLVLLITGQGAEGHDVALARREINQLDPRVAEPHDLIKLLPAPQGNTFGVKCG